MVLLSRSENQNKLKKYLKQIPDSFEKSFQITGSKSESNRLLILQKLFHGIDIGNCSNSDDSNLMKAALSSGDKEVYIGHAGTAMRFLSSYFAVQNGRETILTGSSRMKERPIGILVDALRSLGAEISYLGQEGYPPLLIKGKSIVGGVVKIDGSVSSQYISSLLLIGAFMPEGLQVVFTSSPTSIPYINMTLHLLGQLGIEQSWLDQNNIRVASIKNKSISRDFEVESDWSSASYHFSMCALSRNSQIELGSYKEDSLQGDSALVQIYKDFGVTSSFEQSHLILKKDFDFEVPDSVSYDLSKCPDIAQTIAVTCFGIGIACDLYGLHTLKIKETDRLLALKTELSKFGADIEVTNDSLHLKKRKNIISNVEVETYQDHRMAMAFAPLCLKVPLTLLDADVVSKSYPEFWKDWDYYGETLDKA
jgi:3-phosphoshikimate 1-carboxyvinyltransferase